MHPGPHQIGLLALYNIQVNVTDFDQFLSPACSRGDYKPFRIMWSVLDVAAVAGDKFLKVDVWPGYVGEEIFYVGDKVVVSDGTNSEERVITSITAYQFESEWTGASYDPVGKQILRLDTG